MTPEEFLDKVDQVKEHIQAGDVFQLVLSQRFQRRTKADPFEVYRYAPPILCAFACPVANGLVFPVRLNGLFTTVRSDCLAVSSCLPSLAGFVAYAWLEWYQSLMILAAVASIDRLRQLGLRMSLNEENMVVRVQVTASGQPIALYDLLASPGLHAGCILPRDSVQSGRKPHRHQQVTHRCTD